MVWTAFFDTHSGGRAKEKAGIICIEAPIKEAKIIFYNRFGHSPDRITCTCCGPDYSISEHETFEEAAQYPDTPGGVIVIPEQDIMPAERIGEVPEQGYVWKAVRYPKTDCSYG